MCYDRRKYEELILRSPLFALDRDTETAAYKREFYRMTEYLYCYLLSVNRNGYEPFGCEIMETAVRCINAFVQEKGEFLHYFCAAWKKEYGRLQSSQASDEKFHGIKITEEDRRNIRRYLRLADVSGAVSGSAAAYEKIAGTMGISVEKVYEIAQMNDVTVFGDSAADSGEILDIWERIPDSGSFEQELLSKEMIPELLRGMERAFSGLQDRQKSVVSDVLTCRIWPVLPESQRMAERYSFISEEVVRVYTETGAVPTQRSIARKYGRDEASISRTVNEFLKKVKIQMNEVQKWD